ncbi:MAG: sulfate permease [Methanoregulaceae archaeon]|jgi:high affinity sulfate transporter 1|nr:sulfate permease [Methanoregulaceae archaeon]
MNSRGISLEAAKRRVFAIMPVLQWLPSYDKKWLKFDLIAGLTLAAFAIPDNMAYATLAGLPPEYGLYAGIMAPLAYFFFATSRHAAIGPSSSESIMVATFFAAMVISSPAEYAGIVALTAILVGVIAVGAWLLRLGFLVNLISGPVMKGFLVGTGIVIIVSQIPKLLGLSGAPSPFFQKIIFILQNIPETNLYALALGIVSLLLFFALEHKFPRLPGSLIVVVLSIILVWLTGLEEKGVEIVGTIPQGLPELGMPVFSLGDVALVFPLAIGLFVLSFVELSTIARTYAKAHDYEIDNNQELLALGASSVSVGIGQGFPISGSFSKTAVNDRNNAQTQLAGAIAAGVTILVVLYLTGFFYYLAEPVIAALIVVAVFKMVDIAGLVRIGHINKTEIYIALITFGGVLLFGILSGVLIGAALSLIEILYRFTFPHMGVVGRIPDTNLFGSIARHPENKVVPGVFIFRIDAPLIFANAESFKENFLKALALEQRPIHLAIIDLDLSPITDVTAVDMIRDLIADLDRRGVTLRLANASWQVRDVLRAAGIEEKVGKLDRTTTISAILEQDENVHPVQP